MKCKIVIIKNLKKYFRIGKQPISKANKPKISLKKYSLDLFKMLRMI